MRFSIKCHISWLHPYYCFLYREVSCFLLNTLLGHHRSLCYTWLSYTSTPCSIKANCRLLFLACFKSKHTLKVFGAAGQSLYLNSVKYMLLYLCDNRLYINCPMSWFHYKWYESMQWSERLAVECAVDSTLFNAFWGEM